MVEPVRLDRTAVTQEPHLAWNAFVDMIAMSSFDDLSEIQRIAHLVFWYESEVQNGGHLQYFENQGISRVNQAVAALDMMGAGDQSRILSAAAAKYRSQTRPPIGTVEEYVEIALEGEFEEFDRHFHECAMPLQTHLERFLETNYSEFIRLE